VRLAGFEPPTLRSVGSGKDIFVVYEGIPEVVSLDDDATGTAASLSKLAKLEVVT
jgi:hypothetical protein